MSEQNKPIWGKVIFGLIFLIKGWGMALLGVMLGHVLIDARQGRTAGHHTFSAQRRKQGRFIYHLFSMGAKVAKAKGSISRAEIVFMEKLMRHQYQMNADARADAIKIWKTAKDSTLPFEIFVQKFVSEFQGEQHSIFQMLDSLFAIATADGRLYAPQEQLLRRAAAMFRVSPLQYNRIKARYIQHTTPPPRAYQSPQPSPYTILGAAPSDSMDVIKKKYRTLAKKYHPDKQSAAGASEAEIKKAQEKFQAVQEAYEKISSSRQI